MRHSGEQKDDGRHFPPGFDRRFAKVECCWEVDCCSPLLGLLSSLVEAFVYGFGREQDEVDFTVFDCAVLDDIGMDERGVGSGSAAELGGEVSCAGRWRSVSGGVGSELYV